MGYRSDVRIALSKKGYNELNKYLNKNLNKDTYNLLEQADIKTIGKDVAYLGWNSIKWYDGYLGSNEVNTIMDGLREINDKGYSYKYSRIGENYDDIEEESHDGQLDEDKDIPYPAIERYYDDEYVMNDIEIDKDCEVDVN